MSRIENGQPRVDLWILESIAQALAVPVSELLDANVPERQEPDETVIEGRAELAPEVEELAGLLDELPRGVRERLTSVIRELLDLVKGDEPADDEEARRLVRLLDNLPPTRRAHWQQMIEAEAGTAEADSEPESHGATQTG